MGHKVFSMQIVISMGRRLATEASRPVIDKHYTRLALLEFLVTYYLINVPWLLPCAAVIF